MIPRRAAFFWSSKDGKIPWIRWLAPISFAAQHPGWLVELYTDCSTEGAPKGSARVEVKPIVKPGPLTDEAWEGAHVAARSDIWRYWHLFMHGGLYADSDMVFYDSFEPLMEQWEAEWTDCAITTRQFLYIGVLVSKKGCPVFGRMVDHFAENGIGVGYQSAGVTTLRNGWKTWTKGVKVAEIPEKKIYGHFIGRSTTRSGVWREGNLSPGALCIHWFGGCRGSAYARAVINGENWKKWSKTPFGKAVKVGLGPIWDET